VSSRIANSNCFVCSGDGGFRGKRMAPAPKTCREPVTALERISFA
jgi:hypothetical protein